MSFPFKGTVTRVSNGTIELTPENQFDGQKVSVGSEVSVDAVEIATPDVPKPKAPRKAAAKSGAKKRK